MRLSDLIKIDNRFEKSINLLLDLNDNRKLSCYIPTKSSVRLLKDYLTEVVEFSGGRANILIGPYGKGKSHLLLVLMAILAGEQSDELENLLTKISMIDQETRGIVNQIFGRKKFLPVIINTNSGTLSQAFVKSLNQSLKRNQLFDVVPDNYFSEAIKKIEQWKSLYPATYSEFVELLGNINCDDFIVELEGYNYETLDLFRKLYPRLTSGSEFNPFIDDEVISVYRSVNRVLCEKYGYSGIYIIFDEFSKYIEGHSEEGFSADMKVLQEVCEMCNKNSEEQVHLTCVAHKPIQSYGKSLSKEIKNAFRGVEGRLQERRFVVSSQNNYELIADAIGKREAFESWTKDNVSFWSNLDEAYQIPEFKTLFDKTDFDEIIGKGAFPLTPLSAMLLLRLSEKIAQNERTIFTFLTGKDLFSLATYVTKCEGVEYAGADLIYDYFSLVFEEDKESNVHNEWLKAEYALGKVEDPGECRIIKSLAVINMINNTDDMAATFSFLHLATGLSKTLFEPALKSLIDNNLLIYKKAIGTFDFQNTVGINIESEVADCATKYFSKVDVPATLNSVNKHKYILPKKYNQDHYMTRYFMTHFMSGESFMALSSTEYIHSENNPDGYLVVVAGNGNISKEMVAQHVTDISDSTMIVIYCESIFACAENAKLYLAVKKLLSDKDFLNGNDVLSFELRLLENKLVEEMNLFISTIVSNSGEVISSLDISANSKNGINRIVSDICERVYRNTPCINHELINRHNISAQISKARNLILDDYFHDGLFDKYIEGTSSESTIYRALISHTDHDTNLELVRKEILAFIRESKGKKVSFAKLIDKLTNPPYGMRKGVLPIYITEQLMLLDDVPVAYLDKKELTLDALLMANIVTSPQHYYLFVEERNAEKLEYVEGFEQLFSDYSAYCHSVDKRNRYSRVVCIIQSWYRSLPQASTSFKNKDYEEQPIKEILALRKILSASPNPREFLLEQIPQIVGGDSLQESLARFKQIRSDIDNHMIVLKKRTENVIKEALRFDTQADLKLSLKMWYTDLPESIKNSLLSTNSQRIILCIRDIDDYSNEDIIERLSKSITNFFVEDWSDKTIDDFTEGMQRFSDEIAVALQNGIDAMQKVSFATSDGETERFFDFNPDDISPAGHFFESALDDMIEEYGDSLETSEKIGILMNMVKKLMGE